MEAPAPYGAGAGGGAASNILGDHGDEPLRTLPPLSMPPVLFRAMRNTATAFCNACSSSIGLYR